MKTFGGLEFYVPYYLCSDLAFSCNFNVENLQSLLEPVTFVGRVSVAIT